MPEELTGERTRTILYFRRGEFVREHQRQPRQTVGRLADPVYRAPPVVHEPGPIASIVASERS
ncbi:hypothetical protein Y013_20875 [Rhodococcus pyridinivorans SB3094]|uniref:Uncharacterized protein n=1 Tax=Rhodococcus pyridinivorans SB3094 TaxID=1435356 RepID=V9XNB5_9NOCA|nr:hypothetical protein Y013_20875 [Rhodococcus pyridinivorans SB3094]